MHYNYSWFSSTLATVSRIATFYNTILIPCLFLLLLCEPTLVWRANLRKELLLASGRRYSMFHLSLYGASLYGASLYGASLYGATQ